MIDRSLNYGRPVVRRFLENASPVAAVLDIGAGSGADLRIARAVQPGATLHAIEVWPPNVKSLQAEGVQVSELDLERHELPFVDRLVDVVIANQILEHTKEIFWIFHEISRVLRPGGSLILGVPNLASLHNRALLLLGRQPSVIKSASAHVRGFTRQDIAHFLNSVAPGVFALRESAGANFYPFPPPFAVVLARVLPGLAWGLFLRIEKVGDYQNQFIEFPEQQRLETNFRTSAAKVDRARSGRDDIPPGPADVPG